MNPLLHLQMRIETHQITITATGQLTAHTAHLLVKAVIGAVRRFAPASVHLDLSAITVIDYAGVVAIEDCEFETSRKGVLLVITWERPTEAGKPRFRSEARRAKWFRSVFNTGTVCRQHTMR